MLDRSLIDRKIHDSVMETCFESIVTRAFIGAVPIERSQLSAGLTQGLEGYVSDCLKDLGGVRLLQKAIESEQDPNRKLYLSRIWEVCNESANSVVDRVVEENKDDEALKDAAEKVAMTDEEVAKFAKKADNLVPDELVRIIQQKTLDTIKEEKVAYQKDAELEAEISNALNVADEEEESSEPDSPGDEDGNPVGGSDEGAPKAMTQQENGAKSGEQIGTDASESWGAATESIVSSIREFRAKRKAIRDEAARNAKETDTKKEAARKFDDKYYDRITAFANAMQDKVKVAAKKAGIDTVLIYEDDDEYYIDAFTDSNSGYVAYYMPSVAKQLTGSDKVAISESEIAAAAEKIFKDIANSEDRNLKKINPALSLHSTGSFGAITRGLMITGNRDVLLKEFMDAPASESDTSTGNTSHFNDVNNDKASGVCKIDSRENITSEADEIMKDKIMVDAEKQNDAEAKKEVGEGGKVFESWGAFLDAYENQSAMEGFYKNIRQVDEYAEYKAARKAYHEAKKLVKEGKYNEADKQLQHCIGASKALLAKVDDVPDSTMFERAALFIFTISTTGFGQYSTSSDSPVKIDFIRIVSQFIKKCENLRAQCRAKKIKESDFGSDRATKATESDEGFETEPDPKEDKPPQTGCSHAFVEDQNEADECDKKCSPTGERIGQECPCEEKASPKVNNPKAMEAYMHMIAGPNPRPKHATVFSKIQELAYEGICATREQYSGIPFETMAAITKENTFPAFESNYNRGPRQRIDNVARYAFESLATPDEPMDQQENLETSLLTASVIYTFFETLSTMNLYSPKLAEIRKFVDESLPLEQKTLGDKRLLEDAIRSVVADIKSKGAHARTVPEVEEARSDLQIVRERIGMPGFESVRSKAEAMVKDAQESIDARNDRIVASMRPVQAAVESSTALMLRTRDTLKFDRVANLMGRKPNVMTVKAKIDPQAKSKYVAIECYTADNKPAGTSTVVLEGATESLVDYVTSAVKGSKLMDLDKHIVVSDSRNAKIYLDNAN